MHRFERRPLLAVIALVALLGSLRVHAFAPREATDVAGEFSPLFARRLEVGIQSLDDEPDQVLTATLSPPYRRTDPGDPAPPSPASGNPFSVCLGSGCLGSLCLGSACVGSQCLGSACVSSSCLGSGCTVSACGGSVCVASTCVGSVCAGSTCVGSACLTCAGEDEPAGRG